MMSHRRYDNYKSGKLGTPITVPTYPSGKSFTEEQLAESAFHGYHGIIGGVVKAKTLDIWD